MTRSVPLLKLSIRGDRGNGRKIKMLGPRLGLWWNSHTVAAANSRITLSPNSFRFTSPPTPPSFNTFRSLPCRSNSIPNHNSISSPLHSPPKAPAPPPVSGLEDALVNYVFGRKRATEVAHTLWKNVVQKGDTVIDATCGNGYDTLAMLKMIADDSGKGRVYGFDIQPEALDITTSLLDSNVNLEEKQLVKLFNISHSRMDKVVPADAEVRLVAFNLGYLPGGDKRIITMSETTLLALEAAKKLLISGGLISLVVYTGHPGGREELDVTEAFASGLPVDSWTCCKLQMLSRPSAPVLIFMFKR